MLRSNDAMSKEGTRLLKLLGYDVDGLVANIGLEQEIFLIPRDAYMRRPDLQVRRVCCASSLSLRSAHPLPPPPKR